MIADPNLDLNSSDHDARDRPEHSPTPVASMALDPATVGTPRSRRRTRRTILWASCAIVALGLAFLLISVTIHASIAPPVVVMVAGVLGGAFAGVLRRASAPDRSPHTTE